MTTQAHNLTTLDYLPLENRFFPADMPSDKLMILLHGRGGKAEDFTWIPDCLDFDDMHYLLLNAADVYEDGYSWYDDPPHHLDSIHKTSRVLTQTLDILFEKDFDSSKSFLFGFSQGALLTFEFGARYKKTLAGYIAMSGHIDNPKKLLQEVHTPIRDANWLCTHGTKDEALDFQTAKYQIETLQQGGWNIAFKSSNKAHSIEREEMKMIREWIVKCYL